MHSHSKVQAGDLSRLERAVRGATKAGDVWQHDQQVHTPRSVATSRSATPRSTGASTYRSATSSRGSGIIPACRTATDRTPRGLERAQQQRATNGNGLETTRSRSRPRPSTAGSVTSGSRQHQQQHTRQPSGRRSVSSSRGSRNKGSGNIRIPGNVKDEWLILGAYQQLMADEKQAEEDRRAKAGAHADHELPI